MNSPLSSRTALFDFEHFLNHLLCAADRGKPLDDRRRKRNEESPFQLVREAFVWGKSERKLREREVRIETLEQERELTFRSGERDWESGGKGQKSAASMSIRLFKTCIVELLVGGRGSCVHLHKIAAALPEEARSPFMMP